MNLLSNPMVYEVISQSCSSVIQHYFHIHFVGTKFPPPERLFAKKTRQSQIASAGGVFSGKQSCIDFFQHGVQDGYLSKI